MLRFELVDDCLSQFINIIEAILLVSNDVTFEFSSDEGLSSQIFDPSRVLCLNVKLSTHFFTEFSCSPFKHVLSINLKLLLKILKSAKSEGDKIKVQFDPENKPDIFIVCTIPKNNFKQQSQEYSLKLYNLDQEKIEVVRKDKYVKIELPTLMFHSHIQKCSNLGEKELRIAVSPPNSLVISTQGENGNLKINLSANQEGGTLKIKHIEPLNQSFSSDYLLRIFKGGSLVGQPQWAIIKLTENWVGEFTFEFRNGALKYFLGPKFDFDA